MAIKSIKAIICRIASEEYAIEVNQVLSIERIQEIRPLPHSEEYMAGIMHLRGAVIPVMDLRVWLGLKQTKAEEHEQRIVVTESDGQKLGLIVDAATDVLDITEESIQMVGMQQQAQEIKHVANLDGRLILILDVPKLIEQLDVSLFENAEA